MSSVQDIGIYQMHSKRDKQQEVSPNTESCSCDQRNSGPTFINKTVKTAVATHVGYIEDETANIEAIKTHRRLNNRQVQLSAIAGTIGA